MPLTITHHSDALRFLEAPGKYECKQLRSIWKEYEDVSRWDGYCFCSREERAEFLEAFKTWFVRMEQNLGND